MKVVVTVRSHAAALTLFFLQLVGLQQQQQQQKGEHWATAVCYSKVVVTVCLHASSLTHFSLQLIIIIGRFNIALVSALKQTHCARV